MDTAAFATPLGPMGLAAEGGAIVRLYLPGEPVPAGQAEHGLLADGRAQLLEYLEGTRRSFTLPLAPVGTPFRRMVWNTLLEIPYGETISYGTLAQRVNRPKGARAVGGANHHNPIPIFIPCHRVVGTNGTLTGYGGGLELKRQLLMLEAPERYSSFTFCGLCQQKGASFACTPSETAKLSIRDV